MTVVTRIRERLLIDIIMLFYEKAVYERGKNLKKAYMMKTR